MPDIIINPNDISEKDLPFVVMADDRRGLLGFLIKNHTKGNWNHVMCLHLPGYFASQDPQGYREVPIEAYMKECIILKFWSYSKITVAQKRLWFGAISRDLKDPRKSHNYDYLGLFGQAIGQPWINNPFINYCSEIESDHYREALEMDMPKRPTPSKINEILKADPNWIIKGYWFID